MRLPNRLLNLILIFLATLVVALTLYVTNRQAQRIANEEHSNILLWIEATQRAVDLNNASQDYEFILKVLERNKTIPVLLTHQDGTPISVRNIPEKLANDAVKLEELRKEFEAEHEPIRIVFPSGDEQYVYYGHSITLSELRLYPFVQLALLLVLVLLGYLVFHNARRAEQNSVWVGLARETAHQLGTPISSLVAWQQILEAEESELIDAQILAESLRLDVQRLQRVAERFSKIGAKPQLEDSDLNETLSSSIHYMQGRMSQRISLHYETALEPRPVPHNAILLQWVVENLLRNAIDAMPHGGAIAVVLTFTDRYAQLDCSDTGTGIPKRKWQRIFQPGYSTKTRGWGLGLSLAQRIVKEYHRGRLFVLDSSPQKGTTFRLLLPY